MTSTTRFLFYLNLNLDWPIGLWSCSTLGSVRKGLVVTTLSILVACEREECGDGGSPGILSVLSSVSLSVLGIFYILSAVVTDAQSFLELLVEGSTVLKERNSNENYQKYFLDVFNEVSNVIFVKGLREVFEHFIFYNSFFIRQYVNMRSSNLPSMKRKKIQIAWNNPYQSRI